MVSPRRRLAVQKRSIRRIRDVVGNLDRSAVAELRKVLQNEGDRFVTAMVRRTRAPLKTGRNTNRTIHSRTGALRRSFGREVVGNKLERLRLKVFSAGVKYATVQEFGATITPKNARYLTIPLPPNQTPAGVTRKSARTVISEGGYFYESKKGNLLIADASGENQFVLKDEVRIPGRLGFFKTWERGARARRGRLRRALSATVRRARRAGGRR